MKLIRKVIGVLRAQLFRVAHLFGPKVKFSLVYALNMWGEGESRSGQGSTMRYTENLRAELPRILHKYHVQRVFDAPCGDFRWFSSIDLGGVSYIGGDIVSSLIKANREDYSADGREFVVFDVITDPFPACDAWFCRDLLFHLSNKHIRAALGNFIRSGVPYVILTTHLVADENVELPASGFRFLNLYRPPYNFPPALDEIEDFIEGFPKRVMGVWHRDQLLALDYFSQTR